MKQEEAAPLLVERSYEPDPDRERQAVRVLARLRHIRRREAETPDARAEVKE